MDNKKLKHKLIIGISIIIMLLVVFMIARDLFLPSPSFTFTTINNDEERSLKDIDSALIGYQKIEVIETNLKNATGIALNNQHIFICGNRHVIVLDAKGDVIEKFSIDSTANCIDANNNNIYIAIGPDIVQYTLGGTEVSRWESYRANSYITSIAADNDFVYAADAINKRVLKYTANGKFMQEIGEKDSLNNTKGFIIPSRYFDLELGGYNDLWVVNPGYLRLENYSNSGVLRTTWGLASYEKDGFSGCCNPAHIAILSDGNFITYEKGVDKIKEFDPSGQFVCFVAGAGSFKGKSDFQLGYNNLMKDMATDENGLIYVLDAYNRICVFRKIDV